MKDGIIMLIRGKKQKGKERVVMISRKAPKIYEKPKAEWIVLQGQNLMFDLSSDVGMEEVGGNEETGFGGFVPNPL